MRCRTAASRAAVRACTTTWWPSPRSASAVARPTPSVDPVIKMRFMRFRGARLIATHGSGGPFGIGRGGAACVRASQLASQPFRQSYARLDLHPADRDGLDVDAERDAQMAAEGDQLERGQLGVLERRVEGVVSVTQVILNPARDSDAEPAEEPQRLYRSAHREGEHDRDRIEVAVATLVGVVGHQILGRVDVVDDLGDEVGAAGLLLGYQPEVLVVFASVPLGYRDGAEEQVGRHLGTELLCLAERGGNRPLA